MSDIHPPEVASFLLPGDLMIGDRPAHVKTIVGSCLAIMIRFPRLGLAAIAHCLLPEAPAPVASLPRGEALRYVDTAIEIMIRELAEQGASFEDLEVKLFGGADSLDLSGYEVGYRNMEVAQTILKRYGLRVVASSLGGRRGRALEFDTGTGDVLVRKLPARSAARSKERL